MNESEMLLWAPSLRAIAEHDGTYEDYICLMDQYERDLADALDELDPFSS